VFDERSATQAYWEQARANASGRGNGSGGMPDLPKGPAGGIPTPNGAPPTGGANWGTRPGEAPRDTGPLARPGEPSGLPPARTYQEQVQAIQRAAGDPDVARLDAQRAQLIRAGKPMEANKVIEQIKELRRQRYGV
jgi:hypothetical protein